MKEKKRKKILRKLLLRGKGSSRLWAALVALCIGTTLLLLSVMIWWNFQELLYGRSSENDSLGSTFITIGKKVTDATMGKMQYFSVTEIDALKGAPQVEDVGMLTSNRFPVYAILNARVGFATDMFLDAVPDRFIDKKPVDWSWTPSASYVPVIMSSEFMALYNYKLAPSLGLPQLSEGSIKSLAFDLRVGAGDKQTTYTGHVVGFSNRITSVLVPQSFIDYGNSVYANGAPSFPSTLILKVKDPSDKNFINFLEDRNYITTQELQWSKIRAVVEVVSAATGILAILLMAIGTLVFILFVELTIARAQESLSLLLQIGYSPKYVSRFMIKRFLPLIFITVFLSMFIAVIAQVESAVYIKDMSLSLPSLPGWPVWLALVVSTTILLLLVSVSISRAIKRK